MGLKPNDSRNAYLQIADDLRQAIKDGTHGPGDQLPSTAELAKRYDVANMTVQGAMRVLREENLIYSVHGRGTFVRSDVNPDTIDTANPPAGSPEYRALVDQLDSIVDKIDGMEQRLAALEGSKPRTRKRGR